MSKKLYIKNMVCQRCKNSVQQILDKHRIKHSNLLLGEVIVEKIPNKPELEKLARDLATEGFELLEDRESRLINQIKSEIIRFVHHQPEDDQQKLSAHLSVHLNKDYSALSKLFSQVEGRSIENYFIEQRIEKVKEMLVYDELNLSEISYALGFSSVAHLSAQFKKLTGITPSKFRTLGSKARRPIDKV